MTFIINNNKRTKDINNLPEKVFTEIYKENSWGEDLNGNKYCSGSGTIDPQVNLYSNFLINFIKDCDVNSIFEIGCGDFRIMESVLNKVNTKYIGSDVVKELIDYLTSTYSSEKQNFIHLDAITRQKLPRADLCVIRQVLQHLSNIQIMEILKKTQQYKYVIITEHIPLFAKCKNGDKTLNGYTRLQNKITSGVYLDTEPFSLNTRDVLSYRADDYDFYGDVLPALMQTSLIENTRETSANKK